MAAFMNPLEEPGAEKTVSCQIAQHVIIDRDAGKRRIGGNLCPVRREAGIYCRIAGEGHGQCQKLLALFFRHARNIVEAVADRGDGGQRLSDLVGGGGADNGIGAGQIATGIDDRQQGLIIGPETAIEACRIGAGQGEHRHRGNIHAFFKSYIRHGGQGIRCAANNTDTPVTYRFHSRARGDTGHSIVTTGFGRQSLVAAIFNVFKTQHAVTPLAYLCAQSMAAIFKFVKI